MSQTDGKWGEPTLGTIYRNPGEKPLATLVATLLLGGFGYQAYVTAQQLSPWVGVLVLATGYASYRVARHVWRFQNEFVRAELRAASLEETDTPPNAPPTEPQNRAERPPGAPAPVNSKEADGHEH